MTAGIVVGDGRDGQRTVAAPAGAMRRAQAARPVPAPAGDVSHGHASMTDGKPSLIQTFLIADVRGYTQYVEKHGDEAAARLAERFAAIAGETVAARDGTVIELRGDEALAVFPSARQALRAALDYIYANPVLRGLVATAEDWEWSSARWYARLRPVKLEMDQGVLAELARG